MHTHAHHMQPKVRSVAIVRSCINVCMLLRFTSCDVLAERDASRHVQAVNLDAKKPAFQQKMDLELPMSPIEKPSYLDLMDTSNVSLYHDLPRASTEKIPHPHPHFYTSSKFGVGSDEATNRDPGMAGTSAHSHPHLQRPQGDRSVLEESKHHFEAMRKQDKHPAIRQNLDSEVKFLQLTCISHDVNNFTRGRPHLSLEVQNYPMSQLLHFLLMARATCWPFTGPKHQIEMPSRGPIG